MSNKEMSELSKPVAYDYQIAGACIADGHNENGKWVGWNNKLTRYCPPDWMVEEGKVTGLKPLYSQEYVSALLAELEAKDKRIAELEAKLANQEAQPVQVTDEMALAFYRALNDGGIGEADLEEIKVGLNSALCNVTAPPLPAAPESTASHGLHQEQPSP